MPRIRIWRCHYRLRYIRSASTNHVFQFVFAFVCLSTDSITQVLLGDLIIAFAAIAANAQLVVSWRFVAEIWLQWSPRLSSFYKDICFRRFRHRTHSFSLVFQFLFFYYMHKTSSWISESIRNKKGMPLISLDRYKESGCVRRRVEYIGNSVATRKPNWMAEGEQMYAKNVIPANIYLFAMLISAYKAFLYWQTFILGYFSVS